MSVEAKGVNKKVFVGKHSLEDKHEQTGQPFVSFAETGTTDE